MFARAVFKRSDRMKEFTIPNVEEEKSVLRTIRIKNTTLQEIEVVAKKHNVSVNRLINECITYALKNLKSKK